MQSHFPLSRTKILVDLPRHHLEKLDAEILNHQTVYFDHLVARHRGDRFAPVVDHDFERRPKSATAATIHQVPSSTMKGGKSMR